MKEEWCELKKWLVEATEEVVGRKKCGGRGKSWWGEEISLLVQKKKAARNKYLRSKKKEDWTAFREMCKIVKKVVKGAKETA